MLTVNEHLQKNIAAILQTVRTIQFFLRSHDTLSQDQAMRLSFSCAEMALLSIASADEIESTDNLSEKLIRNEATSALRQITIHFLNIQEWENIENIKAYFGTISKHCAFLKKSINLPEIQEETLNETDDLQLISLSSQINDEAMAIIASQHDDENQEARLRGEIQALREILTTLVFERDNLLHVVCKEIEADYMRELGSIEAEIYHAECELRYLLRKMEMMQASINRREQVETQKVDETLKAQYEEYQKVYEEFIRRIMEAAEFQKRRKANKAETKNTEAGKEPPKEETGTKADSQKNTENTGDTENSENRENRENKENTKAQTEDSEEKRLKKLYRIIVKAMHPDLHPNQDEATKELFKQAIKAYKDGDLRTLTEIASTITAVHGDATEDQMEVLLREKTRILTMIRNIKAEIHMIKTRFPYTKKGILDDPVRLKKEKEKLNARLDQAKQQAAKYKKRIAEMEKKYGKLNHTAE